MTESDIRELEHATKSSLPASYRKILLNYPARLLDLATQNGETEPEELFATKTSLLDANTNDAAYIRTIFPSGFFVVGQSGFGDYYAIDTGNSRVPVYIGGPHEGEYPEDARGNPKPTAASIEAYAARLISDLSEMPKFETPSKFRETVDFYFGFLMVPVMLVYMLGSFLLLLPLVLFHIVWRAMRRA